MDDTVIISIFMALEGVHAYSAFLPSVFTIKTFVSTQGGVRSIREGELMASLFLVAISGATGLLTKSIWPPAFGLIAGAVMLAVYEKAIRESPAEGGDLEQHDMAMDYEESLQYYEPSHRS